MMSLILTVGFIVLMCLRVPVSMAIALSTLPPLLLLDRNLVVLPQFMLEGMNSAALLAVPFFILAGNLFNALGLSRRIWDFAQSVVGHLRGGLGHVNVLANMIFAGISGSALADAVALGTIGIPAMEKAGHRRAYATALTLCASVMGPMIPPSINLLIYGAITGESIGRLFLAGVIPGVVIGIAMMATVYVLSRTGYDAAPLLAREKLTVIARRFTVSAPGLAIPFIVFVGMSFGVLTPTEVGVVCIAYALVLGLVYREASLAAVYKSLVESARSTVTIMYIIAVSTVAGWIYTYDGVAQALAHAMLSLTDNKLLILLMINVFLIVMGCILEPIPVLILTVPIFVPVIKMLGVDPIHFGIIVNLNITLGIIHPPIGIGIYVMMGIVDVKFGELSRACIPFLLTLLSCLLLFTYVPEISLWLPNLVMGPQR